MLTLTDANGSKLFPILWHRYDSTREGRSIVHEYASGQLAITTRPAKNRRVRVRLLFNDETAAYVAELMHAHAVGPLTISDPEVPSVGMSYAVVEGSQVRREQVEGHPGIWFVEVDALDTQSPTPDEAAPFVGVAWNTVITNPGMRTTAENSAYYLAPGAGTLTAAYAQPHELMLSGRCLRLQMTGASGVQPVFAGPGPNLINHRWESMGAHRVTLAWTVASPGWQGSPYDIETVTNGLAATVVAVSAPTRLLPGRTTRQFVTLDLTGPQPSGSQIRSRISMPSSVVYLGDYDMYPGGFDPNRQFFDGDMPNPDALTEYRWGGTPNASISSIYRRRLAVPA